MSFGNSLASGSSSSSSSPGSCSLESGKSGSSSGTRKGIQYNPGKKDKMFSEIIQDTPYKYLIGVPVKYTVSINRKFFGHWFLLLKMEIEGSTLPNVSIEISTPDLKSIKREIYTDNDNGNSTYCGIITSTLTSIIEVADRIVAKMERYSIFTSNCQHFCNNFLNHYGFKVYRTTLYKKMTAEIEKQIDLNPEESEVIKEVNQSMTIGIISDAPIQKSSQSELERHMIRLFATIINALVGAN